ncbi:hypothetical protein JBL43_07410 [Aureibaculum sp. A20]|uniref:HEPN domain-containing protein n=1 Tax=Aureibaculum flavum TaxID=2795986 RepID=A0ABS0WPZ3_9FLAO|nr:hypothetical protein [Aureibaculum flavum]MBJ2174058.1 hypothetical protein [Aureibaculum flavum]
MSHLKNKSEINLAAAEVLIERDDFFAPSVHCSYYGCLQYIKSKLNQIGISYQQMNSEISASRQVGVRTLNSHAYPIDLICRKIEEKSDLIYKKSVKDKIKTLKTFREISDYQNENINREKSIAALELSKEIIKLIKNKI